MKDLHISAGRQKSELKWIAGCFSVAFLLNVLSIIIYETSWSEVFYQFRWVFIITCAFYAASVILRVVVYLLRRLFN